MKSEGGASEALFAMVSHLRQIVSNRKVSKDLMYAIREQYVAMTKSVPLALRGVGDVKKLLELLAFEYHETIRIFLEDEQNQKDIENDPSILKFLSQSSFNASELEELSNSRKLRENANLIVSSDKMFDFSDRISASQRGLAVEGLEIEDLLVRKFLRNFNTFLNKLKDLEAAGSPGFEDALTKFRLFEKGFEKVPQTPARVKGDAVTLRILTELHSTLLSDFFERLTLRSPGIVDLSRKIQAMVMLMLINESQLIRGRSLERSLAIQERSDPEGRTSPPKQAEFPPNNFTESELLPASQLGQPLRGFQAMHRKSLEPVEELARQILTSQARTDPEVSAEFRSLSGQSMELNPATLRPERKTEEASPSASFEDPGDSPRQLAREAQKFGFTPKRLSHSNSNSDNFYMMSGGLAPPGHDLSARSSVASVKHDFSFKGVNLGPEIGGGIGGVTHAEVGERQKEGDVKEEGRRDKKEIHVFEVESAPGTSEGTGATGGAHIFGVESMQGGLSHSWGQELSKALGGSPAALSFKDPGWGESGRLQQSVLEEAAGGKRMMEGNTSLRRGSEAPSSQQASGLQYSMSGDPRADKTSQASQLSQVSEASEPTPVSDPVPASTQGIRNPEVIEQLEQLRLKLEKMVGNASSYDSEVPSPPSPGTSRLAINPVYITTEAFLRGTSSGAANLPPPLIETVRPRLSNMSRDDPAAFASLGSLAPFARAAMSQDLRFTENLPSPADSQPLSGGAGSAKSIGLKPIDRPRGSGLDTRAVYVTAPWKDFEVASWVSGMPGRFVDPDFRPGIFGLIEGFTRGDCEGWTRLDWRRLSDLAPPSTRLLFEGRAGAPAAERSSQALLSVFRALRKIGLKFSSFVFKNFDRASGKVTMISPCDNAAVELDDFLPVEPRGGKGGEVTLPFAQPQKVDRGLDVFFAFFEKMLAKSAGCYSALTRLPFKRLSRLIFPRVDELEIRDSSSFFDQALRFFARDEPDRLVFVSGSTGVFFLSRVDEANDKVELWLEDQSTQMHISLQGLLQYDRLFRARVFF